MMTDIERKKLAGDIARVAHWLINRNGGYTKEGAARELVLLAHRVDPDVDVRLLGDAARLFPRSYDARSSEVPSV